MGRFMRAGFVCDGCGVENEDFGRGVKGWREVKAAGLVYHCCPNPDCREKVTVLLCKVLSVAERAA